MTLWMIAHGRKDNQKDNYKSLINDAIKGDLQ